MDHTLDELVRFFEQMESVEEMTLNFCEADKASKTNGTIKNLKSKNEVHNK